MNREIIDEIIKQDYNNIQSKIGDFLKNEIIDRKSTGVVFGLSGGIDSAVIAELCARHIKEKSLALIMPNSKITPKNDTEDAIRLVDKHGIEYKLIDIGFIHKEYSKYIEPNPLAFGNLGARIRSNLLYYYANTRNSLVLGSSDKSEFLIGYFTKYGDGAADLLPIVSLYKTQVRYLAKHMNLSDDICSKPSGPHLWEGHVAETEIGLTYEEVDTILECTVEKNISIDETSRIMEIPISDVDRIFRMHKKSAHKRAFPKLFKMGENV